MAKPKYLHIKKKSEISDKVDPCPVCGKNLYYDENASKRIGVIEENGEIESWKCPACKSEFDLEDNILYIYGSETEGGQARKLEMQD